jgi:hypothetical protein
MKHARTSKVLHHLRNLDSHTSSSSPASHDVQVCRALRERAQISGRVEEALQALAQAIPPLLCALGQGAGGDT